MKTVTYILIATIICLFVYFATKAVKLILFRCTLQKDILVSVKINGSTYSAYITDKLPNNVYKLNLMQLTANGIKIEDDAYFVKKYNIYPF
jgi:hypothetical protein